MNLEVGRVYKAKIVNVTLEQAEGLIKAKTLEI